MTDTQRLFPKGVRVRMTPKAIKLGLDGKWGIPRGRVVGYSYCGNYIRVLREEYKNAERYHPSFWEVMKEDEV